MRTKIFDWPDDKPFHEALGEAIGAASVCWEHIELAGEFQSQRAAAIVEELEEFLKRKFLL